MDKKLVMAISGALLIGNMGAAMANSPEDSFKDVPKEHWAYEAVQKLADDGVVTGYIDGEFKGEKQITRYEMSMIVAKAIDAYDKADAADQDTIDRLSAEFASELNRLGKRVAKVEKRTNTYFSGDTRIRYMANNPNNGGKKLRGGNQFDFRHRLTWQGDIDEKTSILGRLNISQKFGEGSDTTNKNVRMDLGYVTVKDTLGLDKIRIGRSALDSIGHGLIGKAESNDGILLQKKVKDTNYKLYTGVIEQDEFDSKENTQQLTTVEVGHKFNDRLSASAGYYWANRERTANKSGKGNLNILGLNSDAKSSDLVFGSSEGVDLGFCYNMGKYKLFGDYIITDVKNLNSAYNHLPNKPKAWAIQLTNGVGPDVYYNSGALVDRTKVGSDAWMVSYRSVDTGAVPIGGFDTMGVAMASDPYSVFTHATDNVNAVFLAYQKVLRKNAVMSLEYQNFKIKDKSLTDLQDTRLDDTYKLQFQFWY